MTEWFPCCIKQFLLCQHLSWMLRMFSWCIHESYFAVIFACMAAFFFFRQAHDYWYLVYFLFSVVARRGCPCLTNQLSFKAGGKTTSSRHCTVKCLISMNCAEKGGSGGDQQDTRSGSCSIAAGVVEREAVGSSTQDEEEKGKRKRIPRICNRAHQLDVLFVLFFIIFIVLHLAPRCPAGTPQLSWHVCEFLGWVFFPQICTVFSCFQ